jgi:DNA polymerase-3 subunit alpha
LLKSLSEFCDFTKVPLYEDSSHRYYYRTTPFEPFKYAKPSFFMVLDTESNGLPKFFDSDPYKSEDRPEIIQMAWQLYNDDFELIKEKSLLIKPSKKIIWDEQALNLTGLSKEKLEKEGINIKDAMEHFFYDLSASSVVIGHNIEYDLKIIKAEIARNNIDLVAWVPPDNKIIIDFDKLKTFCTMKNTMEFVGIRSSNEFKYPSLNELYQRLFIRKLTNSHNAISDVKATAECFKELVTKYGFSIEGTS